MKKLLTSSSFCFLAVAWLFAPVAHAQINYILSAFQCDPTSCFEQTPPTTSGTAFVSFNATCTGGVIGDFEGSASAQLGVNGPCKVDYVAQAQVTTITQTFTDDCGDPYEVSTVNQMVQILTPLLTVVWSDTAGVSCDGGTTGPTNNGTRPC